MLYEDTVHVKPQATTHKRPVVLVGVRRTFSHQTDLCEKTSTEGLDQ